MVMLLVVLALAPTFGQTLVENGPDANKILTAGNNKNQSFTIGLARFVQVSDADAGKDLALQIQDQGLVALVQAAQKAAASGLASNKLDTSLPNILQSRLNPLPYIRASEVGTAPIAPVLFEQGRDGSFYDPSALAGVMKDRFLIAGFYSIAKEHINVWVLGFSATAGKTGSGQEDRQEAHTGQAAGILPSFSFSGTFELTSLERYPEMFLAEILSWIAGEPLRVVDVVADSALVVPELLIEPEDQAVAYARQARLFIKTNATMLHPVKVSAKGYLPFYLDALDALEALKNGPSYARISPTLQKDPTFSNLADSFQPSALDWPDKKAYSSSLGKFRTYLGYTAVGVPISLLCTGWFVQEYEAASRRGSNSVWLYVSGGLAALSLSTTVTFIVNAGINFLASTKTSQSGGK